MAAMTREYRLQRTQYPVQSYQMVAHYIGAYEGEQCVHADAAMICGQTLETTHRVVDALNNRGAEDKATLDGLRHLLGYVENGSAGLLTISLDDVTKEFHLSLGDGKRWTYGSSIREVINSAITKYGKDFDP